eukprot:4664364-Alexandrium_andersonii.AAC.1
MTHNIRIEPAALKCIVPCASMCCTCHGCATAERQERNAFPDKPKRSITTPGWEDNNKCMHFTNNAPLPIGPKIPGSRTKQMPRCAKCTIKACVWQCYRHVLLPPAALHAKTIRAKALLPKGVRSARQVGSDAQWAWPTGVAEFRCAWCGI